MKVNTTACGYITEKLFQVPYILQHPSFFFKHTIQFTNQICVTVKDLILSFQTDGMGQKKLVFLSNESIHFIRPGFIALHPTWSYGRNVNAWPC